MKNCALNLRSSLPGRTAPVPVLLLLWVTSWFQLQAGTSPLPGGSDTIEVPPYPGYRQICINEIQPNNEATLYDIRQETDPWVELFNPGDKAVVLDGFYLSDNYYQFRKWAFPRGTVIPAKGYLVIWLDGQPDQTLEGQLHSSLRANPEGGTLALSRLVKGLPVVVDYLTYPGVGPDFSYGVAFSATGSRNRLFTRPTPGEPNQSIPTVVINEWLVQTPTGEPGWFELYNPDASTVDLSGLTVVLFADAFQSVPYVIPPGRSLKGHGFLRVWTDDRADLNATDFKALHMPFKLPTSTFTLQIFDQGSRSPISQVVTKVPNPSLAEARYPDGARNIDTVNLPTPGAPNVGLPSITSLTPPFRVREGNSAVIEVKATGSGPLRYTWTFNNRVLPNVTGPRITFKSTTAADSGLYTVVVQNSAGTTSRETVMNVLELPTIDLGVPPVVDVALGKRLVFPTKINGTGPFTFQWKRNGQNIFAANQQQYSKDLLDLEDGGLYTAVVRNEAGVVLSVPVRVDFPEIPRSKIADAFADQVDLGVTQTGRVRGNNTAATKERGEPAHAGNSGGHSVWYQWKPPASGIARFHTKGSSFDTLLAVYQGKAVNALKRIESDDDRGGYYTSDLQFNAVRGQTYSIVVDGFGGDTNEFILSWELEITGDQLPVITSHPASLVVKEGDSAIFRVTAENALAYQWYFNGRAIQGAVENVYEVPKSSFKQVGIYTVRVAGKVKGRIIESYEARLELGNPSQLPTRDKYEPPFQVFKGIRPPVLGEPSLASGDAFLSVSAGTIDNRTLTTADSGTQVSEPPPCGNIGGSSRLEVFATTTDCQLIFDTTGSTYNTILAVYSVGEKPEFTYVACDVNGSVSQVEFPAKVGLLYYVFVDTADGSTGTTVLNWRCGNPPVLVSPAPPQTNTVPAGTITSLNVVASANPPLLSIQWLLNGTTVNSGLNTSFPISGAAPEHAGDYFVVLSNVMGSTTGKVANLFVEVPFEINVSKTNTPSGPKALLRAISQQGFLVETSTNLVNWCAFTADADPTDPFSLIITNTMDHPRLFFRCQPWPVTPPYSPTPCATDFP